MVFHWSLSDNKSPQVSRTLLSILADLSNVVVWIVSTLPPIFKSVGPFTKHLVTVARAPITIGIVVTFLFLGFFNSLARSRYLSFCSPSFNFTLISRDSKAHNSASSLFFIFLLIIRSGRLAEISWSVCISKSQRNLCISFSRTDSWLCNYNLLVRSNLNFLQNSLWISLPTQSGLVLYSFCSNLLHSLIMWLIVSFLLSHNLRLVFCCDLSILSLT